MSEALRKLEAEIDFVADELATMRGKIDSVKAKRIKTGEYADPAWFARITAAIRNRGVVHQRLLRQAAILRRLERGPRVHCPNCGQVIGHDLSPPDKDTPP